MGQWARDICVVNGESICRTSTGTLDGSGSGLWVITLHGSRFKCNWRLIIQGVVTPGLVVPSFNADKESLHGLSMIYVQFSNQDFAFEFADGAFHPGVDILFAYVLLKNGVAKTWIKNV